MASTSASQALAIPKGSLVLVTGASGYIATYIVLEFLQNGYSVRGTVRNRTKAAYFSEGVFEKHAKDGSLELVDVPDMAAPDAYKEAIKGAAAVINVATITSLDPDPEKVIQPVVASLMGLVRTAAAEPSVKRFVHCSSIGTLFNPAAPTTSFALVNGSSWNDEAVELAKGPVHDPETFGLVVYMASKVAAEKAAWKFVEEEKPGFVFNTIHPSSVFGPIFSKGHLNTTPGWLMSLIDGTNNFPEQLKMIHINVKDVAAVHYAAAVDPDVKSQRIITSDEKINWNTVLDILRRAYPDRRFRDDIPGVNGLTSQTLDSEMGLSLLKKWAGRGWIPADQTIRETVESIPA